MTSTLAQFGTALSRSIYMNMDFSPASESGRFVVFSLLNKSSKVHVRRNPQIIHSKLGCQWQICVRPIGIKIEHHSTDMRGFKRQGTYWEAIS